MSWQKSRDRTDRKQAAYPLLSLILIAWSVDPIATLRAVYWLIIRKRLRGCNALTGIAAQSRDAYGTWIRISERRTIEAYLGDHAHSPELSILVIVTDSETGTKRTERTVESVRRAFGPRADILLLPDRLVYLDLLGESVENSKRWLLVLSCGDLVSPVLILAAERAISLAPAASIIHWNADHLDDDGQRQAPFIKPVSWDPILHSQVDGLSSMALIRLEVAIGCCDWSLENKIDLDHLISRLAGTQQPESYVHVPLILSHLGHQQRKIPAKSKPPELIGFQTPEHWPSVTIIIPTRDRLELLDACLSSLEKTDYCGNWTILVVDNDSKEPATKAYLNSLVERGSVRVMESPGPFNFSRLNNLAVEQSDGDFICLLNNDVTVIDADWLTAMVTAGVATNAGAIGPMLLYPDGTIQHAGVVVGVGNAAGHIQRGIRPDTEIFPSWTRVTRQVSVVTAACLLVRRTDYLAMGGLDEKNLAVAFNDVDLCLKLQEIGRRNIYLASVSLIHHESKSRGSDLEAANFDRFSGELAYLQKRWETKTRQDPWFSPLFSRSSERCALQM